MGFKKTAKRYFKRNILPELVFIFLNTWNNTIKNYCINCNAPVSFHKKKISVIALGWHGKIFFHIFFPWQNRAKVLISESDDGEILSRILAKFSFSFVRGSSNKGGKKARSGIIDALNSGWDIIITPDGPRGPYHTVKPGAFDTALELNVPLFLVISVGSKGKELKMWDKFFIPFPFSKSYYFVFGPYFVKDREKDMDFIRSEMDRLEGMIESVITTVKH